jgi:predicted heme/steroid binding protein
MRLKTKRLLIVAGVLVILGAVFLAVYMNKFFRTDERAIVSGAENFPQYTTAMLSGYDGVDQQLPIYLALDGYVYDVTSGREFYGVDGTYHMLAGKDASQDLHIFGGAIIKGKYPVVGVFTP